MLNPNRYINGHFDAESHKYVQDCIVYSLVHFFHLGSYFFRSFSYLLPLSCAACAFDAKVSF